MKRIDCFGCILSEDLWRFEISQSISFAFVQNETRVSGFDDARELIEFKRQAFEGAKRVNRSCQAD